MVTRRLGLRRVGRALAWHWHRLGSMPGEDVEVGEAVRRARLAAGLSQLDVSRRMIAAGHSAWIPTTVTRTERGARALKLTEAGELSRILSWPVAAFLPSGNLSELTTPVLAQLQQVEERRSGVREAVKAYRAAREDVLAAWGPAAEALAGLDDDTEDAATLRALEGRVQRAEAATVRQVLEDALRGEDGA